MPLGLLAALITAALWGLSFVAPRAVEPFSAVDLTAARYGIFGLVSLILMVHPRLRPGGMPMRLVATGLMLGGIGYAGYALAIAAAVRWAGAALPPLVVGTMPVVLGLIANYRDRSVPWRALVLPLGLIAAGVAVVNIAALGEASAEGRQAVLAGLFAACFALGLWVVYALINGAMMRKAGAPDPLRWTGVQGLGAGLGALGLLPFVDFSAVVAPNSAEVLRFACWAVGMGVAGSWLATYLWVVASRRLPLALAAQLIVAETLFALAYGFAFEGRWPMPAEAAGAVLQVAGVCFAIAAFAGHAPRGAADAAAGS